MKLRTCIVATIACVLAATALAQPGPARELRKRVARFTDECQRPRDRILESRANDPSNLCDDRARNVVRLHSAQLRSLPVGSRWRYTAQACVQAIADVNGPVVVRFVDASTVGAAASSAARHTLQRPGQALQLPGPMAAGQVVCGSSSFELPSPVAQFRAVADPAHVVEACSIANEDNACLLAPRRADVARRVEGVPK